MRIRKKQAIQERSAFEERLPIEIRVHVFSFLTQQESCRAANVCKSFSMLNDEKIKQLKIQYKENVFYTVGKPICISKPLVFFEQESTTVKYRVDISAEEIRLSFHEKNQTIKLFQNEQDAFYYAQSLRSGTSHPVHQSAIFKVIYLGNSDQVVKQHLEKNKEALALERRNAASCRRNHVSSVVETIEDAADITYFETHCATVIPVKGTLKIQRNTGDFATIGYVYYKLNEASSRMSNCVVS